MPLEVAEYSAAIVIVVTLSKTIYDYSLTGSWYDNDIARKMSTLQAVKKKKRRDKFSTIIVFGIVTVAAIFTLGDSVMNNGVSHDKFEELVERVEKLEDTLDPTGGSGGLEDLSRKLMYYPI